jgi:four helix bundle protein
MNYFKELKVWQKAIELVTNIYLKTQSFPKEEVFGLTSQMRRFAVSIPSNIAEGCGRNTDKDFNNFLGISLASAFDFKTQLIICKNLNLIHQTDFNFLESEIEHIQNMIIKLKSTLEKKNILQQYIIHFTTIHYTTIHQTK